MDTQKAFDRVPRKVGHKKGLSEVMVRVVMNLYDGANTRGWDLHIQRNFK